MSALFVKITMGISHCLKVIGFFIQIGFIAELAIQVKHKFTRTA